MTTAKTDPYLTEKREISRLVAKARAEGQQDVFLGKRRRTRYKLGLPLEVTTGGARASDTWASVMHNISGGGFGFWSKQALAEKEPIFVREWTQSGSAEWVPARVSHCTVGIQGYLVGARYDSACSPGEDYGPDVPDDIQGDPEGTTTVAARQCSVRVKTTLICAFSAGMGVAAASVAFTRLPPSMLTSWSPTVALVLACAAGALLGWLIGTGEARSLEAFRQAIHRMAKSGLATSVFPDAPSKELSSLQRAFLDLAAGWRQREDDERAQRQRLEELTQVKSNILSIVSHDLRTPLTSILLYTQMLNEELDTLAEEDRHHFLGIISDECNRLSRLVDDLLEVQRLEADRIRWDMRLQDLSGAIHTCARVFEPMASSKSIDFTVDCADSLPPAEVDADRISQVLSNLLSNAIKYTPNGGKVHFSAEARGQEILLRVADTGPGIPRDKWDQIFDRFSQLGDPNVSEIDGFGLGLYIVKRIVECHGGIAWVDSEVGRGSVFSVSLPTKTANFKLENHKEAPPTIGHVLVCDPDPELAATMAQRLSWENYEVRVCHSGSRLLTQLTHGDIDVVVTDVLLPDMNAAEVLSALARPANKRLGVVVHSFMSDPSELSRHGVDVFLRRPVSADELTRAVRVARTKQTSQGLTVLLVSAGVADMASFEHLFSDAGHTPMVVDTVETAAERIRDYSIDVVLISGSALGEDWGELRDWRAISQGKLGLFVLCETPRKRERHLADEYEVTVLVYRPSREEEVLKAVAASHPTRVMEPSL